MNKKWIIAGIIAAVIVVAAIMVASTYNGLVGSREKTEQSFATIQSQYQRRADLIPNLVASVKGAANFEQKTLTEVTEARADATSIKIDPSTATPEQIERYQQSQGQLSQALGRLLSVTENYPELKATESFRDLQSQLEGTENRISVARNDYNNVAREYNTKVQTFPVVLIANMFDFDKKPYFEADKGAQAAPRVNFE